MKRRKIHFDVPFDESPVLGIWGGYRYRAVPRKGGGAFFFMREVFPARPDFDGFWLLAVCPSVEYAKGLLFALMRRSFERGRARRRGSYTNK